MKNRAFMVLLALVAASCTTKNENSALVISKVIPPTATAGPTGVTCVFDQGAAEFTPALPFNANENRGIIAAVVQNNLQSTAALNTILRTDSNTFLPHQVVITYEVVSGSGTAPGQNIVPTSGVEADSSGGSATVGFNVFNGINMAGFAAGTYIRTTFHVEGKLLDGSTVHTSEREYLFQICTTTGCGTSGLWAAAPSGGGAPVSCM